MLEGVMSKWRGVPKSSSPGLTRRSIVRASGQLHYIGHANQDCLRQTLCVLIGWMAGSSPAMSSFVFGATLSHKGRGYFLSHPHRHQDVERGLVFLVLHQRGRARVGEFEDGDLAFDLGGDVEEVAGVEADIERVGSIF